MGDLLPVHIEAGLEAGPQGMGSRVVEAGLQGVESRVVETGPQGVGSRVVEAGLQGASLKPGRRAWEVASLRPGCRDRKTTRRETRLKHVESDHVIVRMLKKKLK